MNDKAEARLAELRTMSEHYAKAYADRTFLEEFRKSKLAMLMKDFEGQGYSTAAAQEREARASADYIELLENLRTATEQSEKLRWQLEVSKLGVAVWQTTQANERSERRAYGA